MALVTTKGASSSSFSFTHQPKNFDVFLSFRGEDTRFGFISHLHQALCLQGIHTFIDNDLERGEEISAELLKTIENSTLSIIVFSENYASSAWCLDELAKIIDCKEHNQSVLPIFYKVDPSEVRKQQGKFGEALTRHEENFNDKEKVQRWRKALLKAGGISGWDSKNRMGREIVRQESPQNPGKRSRLWRCEDALDVLTKNTGSDEIQSIMLYPLKPITLQLKAQIFRKMKNLRLLTICNVHCCGHLEYLPNGLKLLDWPGYPFPSLPPHFSPQNLVVLNMAGNQLKKSFKQVFASKNLRYVDFSWNESIRKIPDLSMSPNIKELKIDFCKNLVEIDDSVGRLDKLEVWNLKFCDKLETLPSCLSMKSLRYFTLEYCKSLKKFPNISKEMKSLEYLDLSGAGISELPPSFGNLTGIADLRLGNSKGHLHLPGSIYNLQRLKILILCGDFTFLKDEEPLGNSYGGVSKYVFPSLNRLSFSSSSNLSEMDFILNYCCPLSLEKLYIEHSNIVTLPKCIDRFKSLERLDINGCRELQEIPRLPQSARYVFAQTSEVFVQIREMIGLPPNLPPCSHMLIGPHPHSSSTIFPASFPNAYDFLSDYNSVVDGYGNEIPNWFNHQCNGNSISFLIGPEFPTIALCVALKMIEDDYDCNTNYRVVISINGSKQLFERVCIPLYVDQLVLCCRLQSSLQKLFEDLNLGDQNLVQIFCETSNFNTGEIAPVITRVGVHVECICSPQKSRGCQISKSIVQRNRRRQSLLHGSSFIMRKQYNTKQPTRSTFFQPLLKARKVSKKKNRPLEARICTCLCLAQTHCQCPKEVGSTYSTGPTSVHSSNSDSPIISRALNGDGSSSVSSSSNSWLSLDVTNWSEFESTLGDGFNLGSSSLNDDSDFSPFPQSKKMRPS